MHLKCPTVSNCHGTEVFIDGCHVRIDQCTCIYSVLILCFSQDRTVKGGSILVMMCHIHLAVAHGLLLNMVCVQ